MTAVEESSAEISAAEFRWAMGHFATGVTVVTSVGQDGEPVGTTASAVSSLSLHPPLVLVCFDRSSLTLRAIRAHGAFVVNVLAAPQRHLSANFARRGVAAAWDGVRHRPGSTGSPRLDGVLAALECTVENSLPGGDHEIVVGRVHDVEVTSDGAAPLLYWRGSYLPSGAAASARPADAGAAAEQRLPRKVAGRHVTNGHRRQGWLSLGADGRGARTAEPEPAAGRQARG
jgi:flavin reductase (DIM6/NTAB) family NADH-FMN oxidoreductase RutF